MQRIAQLVKWTSPILILLLVGLMVFALQLPISNAGGSKGNKSSQKITCKVATQASSGAPNAGNTTFTFDQTVSQADQDIINKDLSFTCKAAK